MKRLYIDDRWMCVYMLIIEERKRLFCVMYALNWKANLTLNAGEQIGLNPPPPHMGGWCVLTAGFDQVMRGQVLLKCQIMEPKDFFFFLS